MKHKSSITHFDFEEIISNNIYYIDKTLLIREIETKNEKVYLFPRPRRFGKTLNMMMLRRFFEKTEVSKKPLFDGLLIANEPEIMAKQGQYPVIWLTFKDCNGIDFQSTYEKITRLVQKEYQRHNYLEKSEQLDDKYKEYYKSIVDLKANRTDVEESIKNLCIFLEKHYNQKPYLLIDEYDSPINHSYTKGFYNECITLLRNLYSSALKDNPYIEKAIITGIYRVAKESIFSGLNNLKVATILNDDFADSFGFTQEEVDKIIIDYEREADAETIKNWYNGYIFGKNTVIYNPWSVLNYVDDKDHMPKPYWLNTSNNDIIKELISNSKPEIKKDIEVLLQGGTLVKSISEDIVFGNITQSEDAIWNFFLFSGYLKVIELKQIDYKIYGVFAIPNIELQLIFRDSVLDWFVKADTAEQFSSILKYLKNKQFADFEDYFEEFIAQVCSYYDFADKEPERVYHALVLGMMVNLKSEYKITSNRESGNGRYDIMLHPLKNNLPAFIFEFKKYSEKREKDIDETLQNALNQIKTLNYASTLQQEGFTDIHYIAIAFKGKKVKLVVEKVEI